MLSPVPRALHPGAWWLWALGLAAATSRTTNPLLLVLALVVAGYVVVARRSDAPWARAYRVFLVLGLVVLGIRIVLESVLGRVIPGHVLVTLPQLPLPDWAAGVRLGGPVTLESVVSAGCAGLQLATLLACIGAANALANPSRLLAAVPGALYEVGVAMVVALSFAPQAVVSIRRVTAARRLRGRPDRGLRGLQGLVSPVLGGALERSVELAASMDSRGYGRRAGQSAGARRLTGALTLGGLAGIVAGVYGLLDSGSPGLIGLPMVGLGVLLAGLGLALGGRRVRRTRYRPDPWALPEWLVAASGVAVGVVFMLSTGDPALNPPAAPLAVPPLPLPVATAILLALLPAFVAPPVPHRDSSSARPGTGVEAVPA
ncbi:MAG TPA: energy-coupling factor transporter transmembrane component T [Mycobacteriales bacterium]